MAAPLIDSLAAATQLGDYALLDSGQGERLERVGPYVLRRPALQAVWRRDPAQPWDAADFAFARGATGYGDWTSARGKGPPRDGWGAVIHGLAVTLKLTAFGHLGLFPEMCGPWQFCAARLAPAAAGPRRFLNLFAYTGLLSLAAARAGAEVAHVDAAKNTVDWARRNAASSGLDAAKIRWLTDDAQKFVARERRRGTTYHGLALDPPTYGRGAKKEVWQIEEHLAPLVEDCAELLAEDAAFLLVTAHTPGLVGQGIANLLAPVVARRGGRVDAGELLLASHGDTKVLPSGSYAVWVAE